VVTTLKNENGFVIAYCEWRLVGPSGYEVDHGEYIWINDMWVHESMRNKSLVNQFIDEIMRIVPQAKACYFQRKDVSEKVRIYNRNNWERRRRTTDALMLRRN